VKQNVATMGDMIHTFRGTCKRSL